MFAGTNNPTLKHDEQGVDWPQKPPAQRHISMRTRVQDSRAKVFHLFRSLTRPAKPLPDKSPSVRQSLLAIVKASWLNLLLICIPIGWALHFTTISPVLVFVFTFLSIIPLAKLLAFATEELATLGGLMNATLGNAVELIVAIIALVQCKLTLVQSSLVGSILSNLLLVLGMCFFAGGTRFSEQGFLVTPSQINSELLVLSIIGVLLPGAFIVAVQASNNSDNNTADNVTTATLGSYILQMSHGVAVILLFIYLCNLIFTLWSHATVMNAEGPQSTPYPPDVHNPLRSIRRRIREKRHHNEVPEVAEQGAVTSDAQSQQAVSTLISTEQAADNVATSRLQPGSTAATHAPTDSLSEAELGKRAHEEAVQTLEMNVPVTVGLLVAVTVLVGVTAEFLVDSIDGVTATGAISQEWVGLILLPIVGNAAEHVTAVTVAVKDKLDLSISVAVGSSIQIANFVIPFMVVLAWIMGKPLLMLFDPFESVVLFLAVITVNYCVQDSKSNWLEGMILMNLYAIIAVSFWFYPGYSPASTLGLSC